MIFRKWLEKKKTKDLIQNEFGDILVRPSCNTCIQNKDVDSLSESQVVKGKHFINGVQFDGEVILNSGINVLLRREELNENERSALNDIEHRYISLNNAKWLNSGYEKIPAHINGWLAKYICTDCELYINRVKKILKDFSIPEDLCCFNLEWDTRIYVPRIRCCWKCLGEIVVFTWPGTPFSIEEPPSPRPKTISLRKSKQYNGKYWVNTCPYCKAIQGDHFLYYSSDRLFVPPEEQSIDDMHNLFQQRGREKLRPISMESILRHLGQ